MASPIREEMKKGPNHFDEVVDKRKTTPGQLSVKEFSRRNSVLTDLWENRHIRTIYHIFLAMLIGLLINTAAYDYLYKGKVRLGFSLIIKGFSNFHLLVLIWICMFLSSLLVYFGFKYWTTVRVQLVPNSKKLQLWDTLCLGIFISYYPGFLYFAAITIIEYEVPYASSITLFAEVTRFLMKMHAFVRSNAPRVLKYKLHTEYQVLCPTFSQFLYFLFAPTLVYQDSYPRSNHIRWNYVAVCFFEVVGVIFYLSFLFERFLVENFEDYGIKPYSWQDVIMIMLRNTSAGMLIMLTTFYAVLHSWMNAFAEMLTFADRMFYKDWWTSSTYIRYYQTWNGIVHDWLYINIYKDLYEIVLPKNKSAARLMAFFASYFFHDFILFFSFRLYTPIFFLLYCGGGLFVHFVYTSHKRIGNILFLYTEAFGMTCLMSILICDYFVRINCPIENPTLSSYFIPRMLTCNQTY